MDFFLEGGLFRQKPSDAISSIWGPNTYENPGQRWLTVNIFCFDREYLLNYGRYGKTVNKFFVATSMYFSKMQKFLDFEVFKGVKRYDEKNCHF